MEKRLGSSKDNPWAWDSPRVFTGTLWIGNWDRNCPNAKAESREKVVIPLMISFIVTLKIQRKDSICSSQF
jgi:hypothetical protein|tara:strand:+ start:1492 stop:1704 length:213 start_codon:yes stop_codon:yes gene_type:complete